MALDKVTTGVIADDAVTGTQIAPNAIEITDVAANVIPVKPHIQPGTLQPALAGKLLDGTTSHSGAYGTAQSDGHKYYYTDIKGSKSIKDPRIGAHFGGQRHKCKSLQRLEEESGAHIANVYSVDGREWMRAYGRARSQNGDNGSSIQLGNDGTAGLGYCEIVGYFTTANLLTFTWSVGQYCNYKYKVDGGSWSAEQTTFQTSGANSPLSTRYVDRHAVGTIVTGQTLGIHTLSLQIPDSGDYLNIYGIEFIVHDTSNVNNIQIPAQNVVSYGKKFSLSATTPHYNPFDGMSGAKTLAQLGTYIDTATSLGMENWKAGTSNYYKPFNGGRVVRWVDSSGTIKTSVTMMPPNAQNMSATGSNAFSNAEVQAGTNDHTITFDTTTIANASPLHEVAKAFNVREFGIGSINGGHGGNYADASMLQHDQPDDIAFAMDDGLTAITAPSVCGQGLLQGTGIYQDSNSAEVLYMTFIGTGITGKIDNTSDDTRRNQWVNIAQNLSYGTHVLRQRRESYPTSKVFLDGIEIYTGTTPYTQMREISFHQPKMPPIPEEAVVISDYMLMADYVVNTSATIGTISKGVRRSTGTKDHQFNAAAGLADVHVNTISYPFMFAGPGSHASNAMTVTLPYFGTSFTSFGEDQSQTHTFTLDGSAVTPTEADSDEARADLFYHTVSTLGLHTKAHVLPAGGYRFNGTDVATPTHTSSHYQEFEDPLLKTLVGGDRNMEQTNLVVTPDGKTWDEVTRNTSYIGNMVLNCNTNTAFAAGAVVIFDDWRGTHRHPGSNWFNKDWAIARDKVICLVAGEYQIYTVTTDWTSTAVGPEIILGRGGSEWGIIAAGYDEASPSVICNLERDDYVKIEGHWDGNHDRNQFWIVRLS